MNKKTALIALGALSLMFVTCKKESSDDNTQTTTTTTSTTSTTSTTATTSTTSGTTDPKELAKKDYNEMYVAADVANFTWNGNTGSCDAGTLTQEVLDKALLRIKYFRKAAGLRNDIISMEADLSAKCQQNALMIKSNNKISHQPPNTWSCWTADGREAAENGNIAIGISDVDNIGLWMEDGGTGNERAGHRRWILFSNANKFGFGSTNSSGTLWVINDINDWSLPANTPEYIAWPPKGFVPKQVVYPRWSFSVPYGAFPFAVDFSAATVTMKDGAGAAVTVDVIHQDNISNSYVGDNSIVWEPSGIDPDPVSDLKYTVKINNVMVNGVSKNYEYDVTIFNP